MQGPIRPPIAADAVTSAAPRGAGGLRVTRFLRVIMYVAWFVKLLAVDCGIIATLSRHEHITHCGARARDHKVG